MMTSVLFNNLLLNYLFITILTYTHIYTSSFTLQTHTPTYTYSKIRMIDNPRQNPINTLNTLTTLHSKSDNNNNNNNDNNTDNNNNNNGMNTTTTDTTPTTTNLPSSPSIPPFNKFQTFLNKTQGNNEVSSRPPFNAEFATPLILYDVFLLLNLR